MTPAVREQLVEELTQHGSIGIASSVIGVSEQTVRNWLQWGLERPDGPYGELVVALDIAEQALSARSAYPNTKAKLNKWFWETLGVRLPAKSVCPGHDAPLDIAWDIFAGRVEEALVLASRSGGKTELLAMVHIANCYWKPGYTTTHFGSVENQAKRAYEHFQRFLGTPALRGQAPDSRIKSTKWRNGSEIEILPGTEKQTQGPHTYLVSWDELESGERQPYENARGIPINAPDGQPGQFITTSTRQKAGGLMQQALDDAPARGARIYTFCVWETITPTTIPKTCRHTQAAHLDPLSGKAWSCLQPLAKYVKGLNLKKADGWRPPTDVLATYRRMSEDTFETQVLNMRPETGSLIYPKFSEANISEDAEYEPGRGVLWGWDSGFNDDTWIGFFQMRGGAFWLFDEVVGSHQSERHWIREGLRRVTELPDYEGPSHDEWRKHWEDGTHPPTWPAVWPHATGDPTAAHFYFELKEHGVGRSHPRRVKHTIDTGQNTLRAAMAADGKVRLYVHPRCVHFLNSVGKYAAAELPDGSYSELPENTPGNHKFSHPLDGTRYLIYRWRRELGLAGRGDD